MSSNDIDVVDCAEYFGEHPEYQDCREYGHAMRGTHKGWLINGVGRARTYVKKLRCSFCTSERVDEFSLTFEFIRRRYTYADGYLVTGSSLSRYEVRRWDIEQATKNLPAQQGKRKR